MVGTLVASGPYPSQPHSVPTATDTLGVAGLVAVEEDLARTVSRRPVSATARTWDLLRATEGSEAWRIAWPPRGATDFHDYGDTLGVVLVVAGAWRETVVEDGEDGGVDVRDTALCPRTPIAFPGRRVHDVVNAGAELAISVHVYAPRLTAMTFYEIGATGLERSHTVRYDLGRVVA